MTGRKSSRTYEVSTGSLIHGTTYNFSFPTLDVHDYRGTQTSNTVLYFLFSFSEESRTFCDWPHVDWLPWTTWLLSCPYQLLPLPVHSLWTSDSRCRLIRPPEKTSICGASYLTTSSPYILMDTKEINEERVKENYITEENIKKSIFPFLLLTMYSLLHEFSNLSNQQSLRLQKTNCPLVSNCDNCTFLRYQ